jgi:predicted dienelactone hydrolase
VKVQNSVGLRAVRLEDPLTETTIPVIFLFPSRSAASPTALGPYQLDVAPDGEPAAAVKGVVLISHGSGGSPLVYRSLGWVLAQAGYLVAMPEHPGDNRNDNSLADSDLNLSYRPRHLSLVLDHLIGPVGTGSASGVVVIGHSMGGYSALAIAGGKPRTQSGQTVPVETDERISGLVLLAPATPWYQAPGALSEVTVPIMMRSAEHDPHTPAWQADIVRSGLPASTKIDDQMVTNAGHFSFLSVFPDEMVTTDFQPAFDPPGFDRASYQGQLAHEVLTFLEQHNAQS